MGGHSCSLDQLYKKFSENDVFPSPKLNEDHKKKRSSPEIEVIFSRNQVKTKKRSYLFIYLFISRRRRKEGAKNTLSVIA